MITMLDCIRRTPSKVKEIVRNAKTNTEGMIKALGEDVKKLNRITIIGSGSSHNSSVAAALFMEKVTGMDVQIVLPNTYRKKTVFAEDALYIFVSQSGTSTLVKEEARMTAEKGLHTVSVTAEDGSPLDQVTGSHVDIGCGFEEYGYRTVGVSCTITTLMIIALRLGLERGTITSDEYEGYLRDALKAAENNAVIADKAVEWFNNNLEILKGCRNVLFYGGGCLYGVAIEGALKLLETAKIYKSVGYEAEDGLHGPNLGFNKDDVIVSLNAGGQDNFYATAVAKFGKGELRHGFIIGANTVDDTDLPFECASEYFRAIEFAPVVQVIAYMLAVVNDIPVVDIAHRQAHVSAKYFRTHDAQ